MKSFVGLIFFFGVVSVGVDAVKAFSNVPIYNYQSSFVCTSYDFEGNCAGGYNESQLWSYGYASTNKDVYAPGETIVLSGWTQRNDVYWSSYNAGIELGTSLGFVCGGGNICSGSVVGTAPMAPGFYNVNLGICWISAAYCGGSVGQYQVVDSSCGTYSGYDYSASNGTACDFNLNVGTTPSGGVYTSTNVTSPSGATGYDSWTCGAGGCLAKIGSKLYTSRCPNGEYSF